ncbi:MAG: GNAT family N-acetyltransferase [Rhizobiales bacterium 65-9]|nr:GNAT family N-acetyltransferase [Hyphomicrobiales bacterium]OJY34751.1 MAG: GNAT family N-acetyltransferase [Rhizobiales bacterium 65-9]
MDATENKAGEPAIALTDDDDPSIRDAIGAALRRYNDEQAGPSGQRALSITIRDPDTNEIIGGLTGRTSRGLLFIDLFTLPAHLRRAGLGSRILGMAEAEAKRRGCRAAMLYTISFQAPDFYRRQGYSVLGEVEGDPGATRIFLTKKLV